jgi:glutamate-1-semialdehyde 2,1-aminomutase
MAKGSTFGISTAVEEKIASKVVSLIPSVDKVRFVSSGTEAVMTALRLARGFTGRAKIVKFSGHYHGHLDSLLIQAGSGVNYLNPQASSKGVTKGAAMDTISLPFNDFKAVKALFQSPLAKEIAAVILEPIAANMGVVLPEVGFLEMLRTETKKAGALLIFDEIITGFRVGLRGAQGKYSIDPDLSCFGKIVGGGFPAALVGGKASILDCLAPMGQVYQAGTLSGNPVAMVAGLETLMKLEKPKFYEELNEKTNRLTKPIQKALKNGCLQQAGSMFTLFFGAKQVRSKEERLGVSEALFAKLFRYLFERGIYIPPSSHEAWFVSAAHTDEHLDDTAAHVVNFLREETGSL